MRPVGINKVYERTYELYYRITQTDVEWVLERYIYCKQQVANKNKPFIKPIVSQHYLDRVYLDLIDFISEPDRHTGTKWVLQVKDHFSRMVWFYPLMYKEAAEIAKTITY
jgi:hypothetical protein